MGRYAFFTTGFEYKFRFGVQHSSDILCFGGFDCGDPDPSTGHYLIGWNQSDMKKMEESLKDLELNLDIKPIDSSSYPLNLQGTYALCHDLYELYSIYQPEETVAQYILGRIIHHQLLYAKELSAHYEA